MDQSIDQLIKQNPSAFYLFNIGKLKERIAFIRRSLPREVSLCYAVKANPFIVREIKEDLERFEICSAGEANICTQLGVTGKKMVISGVYKVPKAIERMVADPDFDGIYTAESTRQYKLLCALSEKYSRRINVLLRLTNDSQFGMNESDIESIITERRRYAQIHLLGIQFFSGTQKTSLKKFRREIEYLDAFLLRLKQDYGFDSKELEYGPGFPVSYFISDELDEEDLFRTFSELINHMTYKPKITLELGRSIAACCGQYFTHIVDIKQNKGQNYLLMDGGMHHIIYFGQQMAMKQPFLSVVGKNEINHEKSWTICGSLCSMNDMIAKQIALPDVAVGDAICLENTGAYCMTEGMSLFLSRDLPAVYLLLEDGNIVCARGAYETENLSTPKYERMH